MSRDQNRLKRERTRENILVGISGLGEKAKAKDLDVDYCMKLKTKNSGRNDYMDGISVLCFCLA